MFATNNFVERNKMMSGQKNKCLQQWKGNFGNEYISRNELSEKEIDDIARAFAKIIGSLKLDTVLEVGSNIGNKLCAINKIFKGSVDTFGVEPNKKAFEKLNARSQMMNLAKAFNCDAFNIPLEDNSIDLVFTSGVLIHINPKDLDRALDEIFRISSKYIFCAEYFSHEPEEKTYRGQDGLLFKRDFGAYYLDRFGKKLDCIDYGFLWQREYSVFDNLNWWLFKKTD